MLPCFRVADLSPCPLSTHRGHKAERLLPTQSGHWDFGAERLLSALIGHSRLSGRRPEADACSDDLLTSAFDPKRTFADLTTCFQAATLDCCFAWASCSSIRLSSRIKRSV
jgi:hypothetical protein